jgi:hypothetical protein
MGLSALIYDKPSCFAIRTFYHTQTAIALYAKFNQRSFFHNERN